MPLGGAAASGTGGGSAVGICSRPGSTLLHWANARVEAATVDGRLGPAGAGAAARRAARTPAAQRIALAGDAGRGGRRETPGGAVHLPAGEGGTARSWGNRSLGRGSTTAQAFGSGAGVERGGRAQVLNSYSIPRVPNRLTIYIL